MTKEFDTNIEQTYQCLSLFFKGKYTSQIWGVNCRWSFMSFRWFFSLSRRWKFTTENGVMFLVSQSWSVRTFLIDQTFSYVTSIFYWPVEISAVFTLKPWNDLKTCRNIVFIKNSLNFRRLLRGVSNFLSNVWIDRPLMPSSDVTTPLL